MAIMLLHAIYAHMYAPVYSLDCVPVSVGVRYVLCVEAQDT